ncbi:MAG: carbohydrate ABC transporter permease [Spirochaetes bacterium]|nr:carbohydrate ABC transporter permease [Spirochaetota bacterium]
METKYYLSGQRKWKIPDLKRLILWVLLTVIAISFLLPILWTISSSLTSNTALVQQKPRLIPEKPTIENYITVFTTNKTQTVGRPLLNSAIVSFSTVFLTLFISSFAAYPLARMDFKGSHFIFILILLGLMIPLQVSFISLYLLFNSLGLLNTYAVLILPGAISPFGVFLLRQFFRTIPKELEDVAMIDGCGRLKSLYLIILPLSVPALLCLGIFTFLGSWNSFLWPLIVLTKSNMMTIPVILSYYWGAFAGVAKWGTLLAVSVIASIPTILIFLVFQRYFVQGIATTGLKG